jgi:acyl-CoA synthetase (AMP-forming)/AMP-acid ligase II
VVLHCEEPVDALRTLSISVDSQSSRQGGVQVPPSRQDEVAGTDLVCAFLEVCRNAPNQPAIISAGQSWTYARLRESVQQLAGQLREEPDFQAGDRILLLLKNSPEYVVAFYGTLLAGGIAVPLPVDIERPRLRDLTARCTPRLLLTSQEVHAQWAATKNSRGTDPPFDETPPIAANDFDLPADLAAIFFTSGSTGEPKGVMLSHQNLLSNARSIREYLRITSEERCVAILPFYHAFGNSILQSHLLSGATLILDGMHAFPETILTAIRDHEATSFSAVPELYQALLRRSTLGETPLPSLRYMSVAGGRLPPEACLEVAQRIAPAQFFVMYGQTEATARLSYLPPQELKSRAGSIGQGIPDVQLQVVDDTGTPVQPGELGRIRARGPNIMLGYWNDPAGTSEVLKDGWLYTGDLATVDEQGFVLIRGRHGEFLKINGYRVHPRELEDFVAEALTIERAVAVPVETLETGTRLALFVQPSQREPDVSRHAILEACRKGLPPHKVPCHVEVTTEFPLNHALKLDRLALSQLAANELRSSRFRQNPTTR